ncbi:cobalamin synthesis protein cobW-like protein [Curtobacterium sp. PhB172]|uniref:GTP-binding protein n=1 Tax=Curtobacterium sp. PhB172 TaxID=2485196 RepID=UPI000F4B1157|nr:GTP-binding protein [Curtobacterium sp. PhB172]ROS64159.1 cobalamin synthesis protein cobW-like protein [Curtobacterium sp. PhB172]
MRAAAITLVTALHEADADRVAARITTGHRMHVDGSAFAAARAVAERADHLDGVCGPDADHGLVVTLRPGSDARAVGMMLANAARSETGDDRVLRHVVGVLRADDVAHLLWSDVDDAFVAADRVASLVEYATVIALDRLAPLSLRRRRALVALLHRLAPQAVIVALPALRTARDLPASNGGAARVLASGAGWMRALSSGADTGRDARDDLVAMRYREPLPFHPGRLATVIERDLAAGASGRVLRSKGFFRLASRPDHVGSWSSFGAMLALDPTANPSWDADAPIGQALWFVGERLDVRAIERALDGALLTPPELLAGPELWRGWADPFPVWPAVDPASEHRHE